jgi:hypothetical protein
VTASQPLPKEQKMGALLKASATSADANTIATMANVRNPTIRFGINGYPLRRIVRKSTGTFQPPCTSSPRPGNLRGNTYGQRHNPRLPGKDRNQVDRRQRSPTGA